MFGKTLEIVCLTLMLSLFGCGSGEQDSSSDVDIVGAVISGAFPTIFISAKDTIFQTEMVSVLPEGDFTPGVPFEVCEPIKKKSLLGFSLVDSELCVKGYRHVKDGFSQGEYLRDVRAIYRVHKKDVLYNIKGTMKFGTPYGIQKQPIIPLYFNVMITDKLGNSEHREIEMLISGKGVSEPL